MYRVALAGIREGKAGRFPQRLIIVLQALSKTFERFHSL